MESNTINERVKVYRLPTKLITDVVVNTYINDTHDKSPVLTSKEKALLYLDNANTDITQRGYQYQHLYITTDEDIKKGDNIVRKNYDERYDGDLHEDLPFNQVVVSGVDIKNTPLGRKIVATNDESLSPYIKGDWDVNESTGGQKYYHLPQLSQGFIENYCEVGGIDEVLIEYESDGEIYKVKVDSDNCIIIQSIKNSWTETELIGNQDGGLDHFLLHSSKYTQEEREVVMDAIYEYLKTTLKNS